MQNGRRYVPEHFSHTTQEKSEANDVQIITNDVQISESSSTDTDSEPVNKRSQQNSRLTSFKNLLALPVCI